MFYRDNLAISEHFIKFDEFTGFYWGHLTIVLYHIGIRPKSDRNLVSRSACQ